MPAVAVILPAISTDATRRMRSSPWKYQSTFKPASPAKCPSIRDRRFAGRITVRHSAAQIATTTKESSRQNAGQQFGKFLPLAAKLRPSRVAEYSNPYSR
jgi:hypothetical protein